MQLTVHVAYMEHYPHWQASQQLAKGLYIVAKLKYFTYQLPAELSCRDIVHWSPACMGQSGLYWLHNATSGSDEQLWCDMETMGGGWERVIDFQASTTVPVCPYSLTPHSHGGQYLCSNNGGVVEGRIRVASNSFTELRGSLGAFVDGQFLRFRIPA